MAVASWLLTGVGVGDIALFLAHELGFVLLPGCLLYRCIRGDRSGTLELAAIGYALGSVLEVLAFALTAALHIRPALWAYPPLTIAACVILLRLRARRDGDRLLARSTRTADRFSWTLAGVCAAAIAYITVAYFLFDPLPAQAGSVVYIPDLVFHLGVAGEALHHWPIGDPKVAGVGLPYETFIYMKLAAAAQLTHIPLPTLLFRLYMLPLVVAVIGLLASAGAIISGRRQVGIAAAALFVFVGQFGLDPRDLLVFFNTAFFSMYDSPSYMFGLVVFLAALIVLYEQLGADWRDRRGWLLLGLVLIGCAGTKATILPDLLGGLALYLIWQRLGPERRLDRSAAIALLLTGTVFALTYVLIYHGETGGLTLNPPGSIREMSVVRFALPRVAGAVGHPAFWVLATVIGLIGFCGPPLAGIPIALTRTELRRTRSTALLVALLVASFAPFLLFTHKGGSQNFFTYYGICAGCILSAQGLGVIWDRARPAARRVSSALAVSALAWLGVLTAAAVLPYTLFGNARIGLLYALWIGLPVLAASALWMLARRFPAHRAVALLAAAGTVVLTGALDTPLHTGASIVPRLREGEALYPRDTPQDRGLTPGLQQALAWIRLHTPTDAVIAVNNQFSDDHGRSPDYYYYSAFSERRSFLEGWDDTIAAAGLTDPSITPFPERRQLNDAVFYDADALALRIMKRRFGVGYLLVDRSHGPVDPHLAALGHVAFTNRSAILYRVG